MMKKVKLLMKMNGNIENTYQKVIQINLRLNQPKVDIITFQETYKINS